MSGNQLFVYIRTLTSYLYTVSFLPKCLHLDIEILYPTFVTPPYVIFGY